MNEMNMDLVILGSLLSLIGALILQWFHKLGFKLAKVEPFGMPSFSKRFIIQIASILVGYGLLYLAGKILEGPGGPTNLDALAVVSIINANMLVSIGNMYIGMFIMTLIISIFSWFTLLITGKLLASYITLKEHSIAAIIPVLLIFILYALPPILAIVAGN